MHLYKWQTLVPRLDIFLEIIGKNLIERYPIKIHLKYPIKAPPYYRAFRNTERGIRGIDPRTNHIQREHSTILATSSQFLPNKTQNCRSSIIVKMKKYLCSLCQK